MQAKLTIPFPPTVNHYWKHRVVNRNGRKPFVHSYIGKAGREFRQAVVKKIGDAFPNLRPTGARLKVEILVHAPDKRKRDLSNLLKASEDALTHALVWEDDHLIDDLRIIRGPISEGNGFLEVAIERLTPEPAVQRKLDTGVPF